VQVSTDFVFDGASGAPYRPDDAPNPLGVYGRSKREGEEAVRTAHPAALIVRTAWVHGAGGANFVATMLRLMAERETLGVVADQLGTPTHADGLALALLALAEAGVTGTHHWTDAGVASWYDFAVAIREEGLARGLLAHAAAVRPIATADYPTPARRPANGVLDKTSAWAVTGPAAHWRDGLRACLEAMRTAR
jgi:dTDP-4-dehydrorhamnose reductase